MKRRWGSALIVAAALTLSGCSPAGIDPALTSAVSDAVSSAASAQLGLELELDDRILPGTLTTLLGDMADNLVDTERELQLHQTTDAEDAEYRASALAGVRASLEAVHVAQAGDDEAALAALTASLEELRALEDRG